MKTRIVKLENIYYPEYKSFLTWWNFRDSYVGMVSFTTFEECKNFLNSNPPLNAPRVQSKVVWRNYE